MFKTSDFGFSDSNNPANTLNAVEITTTPTVGTLTDHATGTPVTVAAGTFVPVADITNGDLVFTPVTGASGTPYDSFTFQVQDNGGTLDGGVDTDPNPKTMTIDVVTPNLAPSGTDNTISTAENTPYVFQTSDFGFSDPNNPPSTLKAVEITTLPTAGTLTDDVSGTSVAVTAGTFVPVADITAGDLVFTPATDASGNPYSTFTFQVQNNGGTLAGGVDADPTPNTMTIDIPFVNQAPSGANNTVGTTAGAPYVFQTSDFGFSDPNTPANSFYAVNITSLPTNGTLTDNGTVITAPVRCS